MDYNKEPADRARQTAMNKFIAKDYAGARWFALRAQFLNPAIVGIKQMVATFAMHSAAQHTINGVMDYYGVLGVTPQANDETVQTRYEKLSAMLHPNGNQSIGAEEAFNLVSEAWNVLSDKAKRSEYDSKRNGGSCEGGGDNNGVQKAAAKGKTPKRGTKPASDASASSSSAPPLPPPPLPLLPPPPPPALAATRDGAFWTACSCCKTQYEHHRLYYNQNLMCPHCRNPFRAVETAPPYASSIPNLEHRFDALEWGGGAVSSSTGTNTAAHGSQPVRRESTKRVVAASASASPSTNPPLKRRKAVEAGSNVREVTKVEIRNALLKKSKPTIVSKLEDLITAEDVKMANAAQDKSAIEEDLGSLTINIPHPDFCDFHKNRTAKSFSDDQIWASYDNSSEVMMPRVYFRIDKVLSVNPFKLCITQLTTSEPRPFGLNVVRTCGVFRAEETQICHSPHIFSHKVEAVKGNNHGEFLIYPRRGDVWALYKNWSHDSNYLDGGNEVEYDVVEVFEGYTQEFGVTVLPLMKVAGYASVFRHYPNPKDFRTFSKDDLSIFSHQIPSRLLTSRDAADELSGCRALDAAATPSQFLRVMADG